ncbi:MAG: LemA family protein [Chitinophagaceae bacterium]
MKGGKNIGWLILAAILIIFGVWGCSSYNGVVKLDESVNKSLNNVNAEYQRRLDLVDNLVNTVKGAANFEKETLTQLTEARARAGSINLTADQLTPENIAKFQAAQQQMTGALNRLLVTVEAYPDLKANANFLKLQGQLEGIENDIRNARMNFNNAINSYNTKVRSFPMNLLAGMFGFSTKEGFKAEEGAEKAPKVQF